ncbi:molybdate ABC transporter substrate-binding protein [Marinactinospora thermotolerans]|uniref:Molybdate transport system substrate-binding protein n=1 Tax=Marinactinospora thermotolerans DSM 45154 TaxID=1122192 RepID=A0A1T4TA00_9ACTN|nr:molybdate ABC transporter substrate-binding protein [Marinactinospora thermotolerans]SKA37400.1 molybdate transport system substrate-binding protein [Marinactinospora thermotolerans DSM 45154]
MPDRSGSPAPGRRAALAAALLLSVVAACAPVEEGADGATSTDASAERTLTVFAAASLTGSFEELAERFEDGHAGTRVEFNFAGSSDLAAQIAAGAPADVFASANTSTMRRAVETGAIAGEPEVFARNVMEIAVPAGNPARIEDLDDLARADVKVALCAEEVPCGTAARTALEEAGVQVDPVTLEQDVKAALTKVRLNEVDAALVYRTDVREAGDAVEGISFPEARSAVNDYPIAVVAESAQADLAEAWVGLVTSDEGRAVLLDAGFQAP